MRDDHSLANGAGQAPLEEEQHDAEEVERLAQKLLALWIQQHVLERVLQIRALSQALEERVEVGDVAHNVLEHGVEALEQLRVVVGELLVGVEQRLARVDSLLVAVRRLEVREIEQYVSVFGLCGVGGDRYAAHEYPEQRGRGAEVREGQVSVCVCVCV
jgi:hypothetical protein